MKKFIKPIWDIIPKEVKRWLRINLIYKFDQNNLVLVDVDQLRPALKKAAKHLKEIDLENFGDYLEFGVYDGTSLSTMYDVFHELKIDSPKLFGFDSFKGLPPEAAYDDNGIWSPGQYRFSFDKTLNALKDKYVDLSRISLIKGFYSETLKPDLISNLKIEKAGIILIDCDMYLSTRDALNFCKPLIKERTIIIFEEWLPSVSGSNIGQKKAFNEFLSDNKNFKATVFDHYTYFGRESGIVFLVENLNP